MSRRNSGVWLLVMAAVLVSALPLGMNWLIQSDPTVKSMVMLRDQMRSFYADASLTQRFEPPLTEELPEGEKHARVLVLGVSLKPEQLRTPEQHDKLLRSAGRQLGRFLLMEERLSRRVDFYQVELLAPTPPDSPVLVASQRFVHDHKDSSFNYSPTPATEPFHASRPAGGTTGDGQPKPERESGDTRLVTLRVTASGDLTMNGHPATFEQVARHLATLRGKPGVVSLWREEVPGAATPEIGARVLVAIGDARLTVKFEDADPGLR